MSNELEEDVCENGTTHIPPEQQSLIYTRYLYGKLEVKQSLLISLLEKKSDEAMFWAYELYYSGFKQDVFEFVKNIYQEFYTIHNPELQPSIEKAYTNWISNVDEAWHLGSIVMTLCCARYQINSFMEKYYRLKCKPILLETVSKKTALFIRCKAESIIKYKTVEPDQKSPRFYLEKTCQYKIRKEANVLFQTTFESNKNDYFQHWLYYASKSPVWLERIENCNGIINDEKKQIDFTDDDMEDFYDEWGLEPDEQLPDVVEKSIGTGKEAQLSMRDFCEKYGAEVLIKILKVRQPR